MVTNAMIRVTAAVMVSEGAVLLARRPQGDRLVGHWELPGGKIEPGETAEECLARELAEECGIEASVGELFAESMHRYPHIAVHLLAFWVHTWTGEFELHAHDAIRWVALGDLDGLTLAPADIPILERLRNELS